MATANTKNLHLEFVLEGGVEKGLPKTMQTRQIEFAAKGRSCALFGTRVGTSGGNLK